MTHRSSRPGPLALLLALALLLVGCGGAAPAPRPPSAPFVAAFPDDTPGSGGVPGTPTPPRLDSRPSSTPTPSSTSGRPSSAAFPSDLVRFGNTIFTVDADQIEADGATVTPLDAALPLRPSTEGFLPVAIRAEDLVDDQGHAGSLSTPVGFGFFVNDLLVVSDRLGFVARERGRLGLRARAVQPDRLRPDGRTHRAGGRPGTASRGRWAVRGQRGGRTSPTAASSRAEPRRWPTSRRSSDAGACTSP